MQEQVVLKEAALADQVHKEARAGVERKCLDHAAEEYDQMVDEYEDRIQALDGRTTSLTRRRVPPRLDIAKLWSPDPHLYHSPKDERKSVSERLRVTHPVSACQLGSCPPSSSSTPYTGSDSSGKL